MATDMSSTTQAVEIDVRQLPPRERHPRIFDMWEELPFGGAILLINDHDPVPLYYQFAVEYVGEFHWEYLEQGPATWRVRIAKGDHPDPGFRPVRGTRGSCLPAQAPEPVPIGFVQPWVLDVRPILAAADRRADRSRRRSRSSFQGSRWSSWSRSSRFPSARNWECADFRMRRPASRTAGGGWSSSRGRRPTRSASRRAVPTITEDRIPGCRTEAR